MDDLAADLIHALDPVAFAVHRLHYIPDPWQERLLRSTSQYVALNCSRQSGKSTVVATLAVHVAIYQPGSLVLVIAPSLRQSQLLFKKIAIYLRDLGEPLDSSNLTSCSLANGSTIVSLPGDGETVRGYSPNLVLEDEAAFVSDATYAAISPMLGATKGRLILLSTPNGARGHFHGIWEDGPGWEHIRVTANECPRIDPAWLEDQRNGMPARQFKQEYLCQFEGVEDGAFDRELIRGIFVPGIRPLFQRGRPIPSIPRADPSDRLRRIGNVMREI